MKMISRPGHLPYGESLQWSIKTSEGEDVIEGPILSHSDATTRQPLGKEANISPI